jgi:heterodisulfide reductase subunit A2
MFMTSESKKDQTRVGVYICHCGGNISDHVDVHRLAAEIEKLPGVTVAHTNMFMCSDPGQQLIQEDIRSGKIERVVVASCAPSLHELTFRSAIKRAGMNPYLYEHANIREQVSWVHHGDKATAKATSLVAAAVAKAKNLEALEPIRVEAQRHATVIGAGVAGMRAALDLSRRGIEVALIEKTPFLGGQTAKLDKLMPSGESAEQVIRQLAEAVFQNPRISLFTCAEIIQSEGYVGNFKLILRRQQPEPEKGVDLQTEAAPNPIPGTYVPFSGFYPSPIPSAPRESAIETGAIVFATGFQPYTPHEGEYGYLKHPEVITLPELIRCLAQRPDDGDRLTIDGHAIRRVAMIHCVGSRQIPGIHEPDTDGNLNEYCSRTCCGATLQAAVAIRERYPKTHVFEYYRDIRTYGRGQEDFYDRASACNVTFFRFEPEQPPVVERTDSKNYPLRVRVKDTLTFGEELSAEVDLVVLAVGMVPSPISNLIDMLKLPVGTDRFLQEVHPKLRPVEVANTGILLAGTCQAPMDVGEACAAAQAAAVKGSTLLAKGYVELDPYVAEVRQQTCAGHGRCVEVCPIEGAVRLVEHTIDGRSVRRAQINPALCTGCGICVPECPQRAIDLKGWTLKQYEEMVDAIVAA